MMRALLCIAAALALSACSTLPQVIVTGADTFELRIDPAQTSTAQADARASQLCHDTPHFLGSNVRFDGLTYRSYRCHRR